MATLARAPTIQGQHARRIASPSPLPALLTTTLAVVVATLPFQTAPGFPGPSHHPSKARSANADTSRGTAKVLFADAVSPNAGAEFAAAQHPNRRGLLHSDTSAGVPRALFAVAPESPPVAGATHATTQGRRALYSDTSAGIPKALISDAVVAVFDGPYLQPVGRTRLNGDTTANSPLALIGQPPVQAPLVVPQILRVDFSRALRDTSAGIPKTLTADAVTPTFNPPHTQPDRARLLPANGSSGTPVAITSGVVQAPLVNAPVFRIETRRHVQDTSAGVPKTLYSDAVSPIFSPQFLAPDRVRPAADTSLGTGLALATFVSSPPFTPAPHVEPAWRKWLPADTAAGMPYALLDTFSAAPFVPAPHIGPAWRKWQPQDTSATVLPLIEPPSVTVVLSAPPTGRRTQSRTRPANIQKSTR